MSTRHEQGDTGFRKRPVFEGVDGDVRGQMVHPVQGHTEPEGQGFRCGDADQQRTGQTGTCSDRDRIDVIEPYLGLAAGALDGGQHGFQVRPACHLRNHPAKPRMLVDTARDGVSQQCASPHETHSGFIA